MIISEEKPVKRITSKDCHPKLIPLPKEKDAYRLGDMQALIKGNSFSPEHNFVGMILSRLISMKP